MQYDDDELEARQLGFVTVHCKHAETSVTPPNRLSLLFYSSGLMLCHLINLINHKKLEIFPFSW